VSARFDQEPGRALDRRGQAVDAAEEGARLRQHVGRHLVVAHDLDQLHARHRVEEMHADEMIGPLQALAQLLQRNARGVGGENRARLHPRLGRGIDLALELERLRHRLDDEIGEAHALTGEIGDQPVERVADRDALVTDLAVEIGRALDRLGQRLGLHVGERDGEAVPRAPSRDVAAHGAGADDVDAIAGELAVREALELVAQEERADQVARGVGDHKARERRDLRLLHRLRAAAVIFPKVDQGIGRGIMLDLRLFGGLRAHALGRKLAAGRGIDEGNQHPAALSFQFPSDRRGRSGLHVPLRHHRVDEAKRLRAPVADVAAGQHHAHGLERIDQARQPHGAAEAGMQPEHHLGEAEARVVDRDAEIAGERDLKAAAEAIAMDDGDRRHAQTIEPVDHGVGLAQAGFHPPPRRSCP